VKRRLALVAALLLAACNRQPEQPAAPAAPAGTAKPVAAAPSLATASRVAAYDCDKNLPVTAAYGTDARGRPDLTLVIKGESFALLRHPSDPRRFTASEGIEPGQGLIWTLDASGNATLAQAPADRLDDPSTQRILRHCTAK
jgi:hypothetical protein